MMAADEFEAFPKIARLRREIVVTEKIDGTNAQVFIAEDGTVAAGSRSRMITSSDDNYGFAAWVERNVDQLRKLGPGRHFGEWWGSGVNRGYGLEKGEKRFSLFNVQRWADDSVRPACCHVVPVIYSGTFSDVEIEIALARLRDGGSIAAPGFMKPEGVIVFHSASRQLFKVTIERDAQPKGVAA